jgi:hypothetical protein
MNSGFPFRLKNNLKSFPSFPAVTMMEILPTAKRVRIGIQQGIVNYYYSNNKFDYPTTSR